MTRAARFLLQTYRRPSGLDRRADRSTGDADPPGADTEGTRRAAMVGRRSPAPLGPARSEATGADPACRPGPVGLADDRAARMTSPGPIPGRYGGHTLMDRTGVTRSRPRGRGTGLVAGR